MEKTYDTEIEECLRIIDEKIDIVYTPQYKEFLSYCEQLFNYAVREESDELFAKAYFCLMQYYASDNDCINTISSASEGVKYQLSTGNYELAARSYNVLGIYENLMGDYVKAVEAYLKCLDITTEHDLPYIHGMASYNLADLFQRNSCYERALHYYALADAFLDAQAKKEKDTYSLGNLCCFLGSSGHCLIAIGNLYEARENARRITEAYEQMKRLGESRDDFGILTFLAALAYAEGEIEQCKKQLAKAKEHFHQSDNYTDYLDDILFYIRLHMDLNRTDEAVEILDYFIGKCEEDDASFYIYSSFLSKRIECAKILKSSNDYEKYTDKFLKAYNSRGVFNMEAVLQAETNYKESARLQKAQAELSSQNEELLMKSNHDTLTRLPNRSYWHSYAENALSRAIKEGHHFGVEILDIDCFKNVNDTYGHIEGDRYLVEVANALFYMAKQNNNVFVARYGGDEFVVVYYNMSDEEIFECMKKLSDAAHQIALADNSPIGVPYITLSQGCCNRIPISINRLWDYLSKADKLLYQVKRDHKDGYIVNEKLPTPK